LGDDRRILCRRRRQMKNATQATGLLACVCPCALAFQETNRAQSGHASEAHSMRLSFSLVTLSHPEQQIPRATRVEGRDDSEVDVRVTRVYGGPRHPPSDQDTHLRRSGPRTKTPTFVAADQDGTRHPPSSQRTKDGPRHPPSSQRGPRHPPSSQRGPRHPPSSQRAAGRVNRPRPHSALRSTHSPSKFHCATTKVHTIRSECCRKTHAPGRRSQFV
jgi:hypothetical protein